MIYLVTLHGKAGREGACFRGLSSVSLQAPTCADDTALFGSDPNELQFLINICKDASLVDGYTLQENKIVVMKMDSVKINNYPADEAWSLGLKDMPIVSKTIHMGIIRCSTRAITERDHTPPPARCH